MRPLSKYVAAVLLFSFLLTGVNAAVEPEIQVRDMTPQPAEPGDTVKLNVLLKNNGETDESFEPLDIETVKGVNYTGTTSNLRGSYTLCGGCQTTGTIYLKVSENADSGSYPVDISMTSGDTGIVEKTELEVEGASNLVVSLNKSSVVPGERSDAELVVENTGTDRANTITLSVSADQISVNPEIVSIDNLEPGEKATRTVEIIPEDSADTGIQRINSEITYKDSSEELENSFSHTVRSLQKAELAVSSLEVEDATLGKPVQIIAEVENLGPGDAEKVESRLSCTGASVNRGEAFVGILDNEESIPAVYQVTPTDTESSCTLNVDYEDRQTRSLEREFSFTSNRNTLPYMVGASFVIGVLGLVYWQRRKEE